MKDVDFHRIIELRPVSGGFLPVNDSAKELLDGAGKDEILSFTEVTDRDLKLHRCYMSLLSFLWSYYPDEWKKEHPKKNFYNYVKALTGQFEVKETLPNGVPMIEWVSISFGRMSEVRFREYVKNQLPYIFEDLHTHFDDFVWNNIIETVENDYEKFFSKLH